MIIKSGNLMLVIILLFSMYYFIEQQFLRVT